MGQRGRPLAYPNGSQVITLRFPAEWYRLAQDLADAEDRSINSVVLRLFQKGAATEGHPLPARATMRDGSQPSATDPSPHFIRGEVIAGQ